MASIVSGDLLLFLSAGRPTADTGSTGGAIDLDWRPVFTQLAANDDLEVVSSAAGDTTQTATVWARNAGGSIVTEGVTLNGTTAVIFSTISTVERVLKFQLSADAAGTVTLRRSVAGATVGTVPIGERGFQIMFYDSSSDPGTTIVRYEKMFAYNVNSTNNLLGATVELDADPSTVLNIRLEDAQNDNNSAADRLTEPTGNGGSWVGVGTAIAVPGTDLALSSGIGTWVRQSLTTGNSPIRASFDMIIAGSTT